MSSSDFRQWVATVPRGQGFGPGGSMFPSWLRKVNEAVRRQGCPGLPELPPRDYWGEFIAGTPVGREVALIVKEVTGDNEAVQA